MKFTIPERILLFNLTQNVRGNMDTLQSLQDFHRAVTISDSEREKIGFRVEGQYYKWDVATNTDTELNIPKCLLPDIKEELLNCFNATPPVATLTHKALWDRLFPGDAPTPSKKEPKVETVTVSRSRPKPGEKPKTFVGLSGKNGTNA